MGVSWSNAFILHKKKEKEERDNPGVCPQDVRYQPCMLDKGQSSENSGLFRDTQLTSSKSQKRQVVFQNPAFSQ